MEAGKARASVASLLVSPAPMARRPSRYLSAGFVNLKCFRSRKALMSVTAETGENA